MYFVRLLGPGPAKSLFQGTDWTEDRREDRIRVHVGQPTDKWFEIPGDGDSIFVMKDGTGPEHTIAIYRWPESRQRGAA